MQSGFNKTCYKISDIKKLLSSKPTKKKTQTPRKKGNETENRKDLLNYLQRKLPKKSFRLRPEINDI